MNKHLSIQLLIYSILLTCISDVKFCFLILNTVKRPKKTQNSSVKTDSRAIIYDIDVGVSIPISIKSWSLLYDAWRCQNGNF